jgi:Holliday junction resolvase-like predicted endonuclease
MSPAPDPRCHRGRVGRQAEVVAGRALDARGWRILARNVIVGRDEIDLVCLDPDGGSTLVFVEVRGHSSSRFGAAEESVDGRKLARTYRAAIVLVRSGWAAQQGIDPRIPWRVDVIAVELVPRLSCAVGGPTVRHIRGATLD